jgi:hypothetical protein
MLTGALDVTLPATDFPPLLFRLVNGEAGCWREGGGGAKRGGQRGKEKTSQEFREGSERGELFSPGTRCMQTHTHGVSDYPSDVLSTTGHTSHSTWMFDVA